MLSWVIIVGLVVLMYIIIYKYEKKMNNLHQMVNENKEKLELHCDKISKNCEHIKENYEKTCTNHSRLDKHDNHIEQMWVTIPKRKDNKV